MSNIALAYALAPNFYQSAHVGLELIHVGLENQNYSFLEAVASNLKLTIIRATPRRILHDDRVYDWVDVELIGKHSNTDWSNFDTLDVALDNELTNTSEYVLEVLDFTRTPLTHKSLHTHTNNASRFTNPSPVLSEVYVYNGIHPTHDMSPDTMHRVITIHPSKECAVVDSYLPTSIIQTRTAARYFLTPYVSTPHRIDGFTFGITGQLLLDRLKSPDLFIDVIHLEVVYMLLAMTKEQQYHLGLIVTAFRRLYQGISGIQFSNLVMNLNAYEPVVTLILGAPGPSDVELNDAFNNVPTRDLNDLPF